MQNVSLSCIARYSILDAFYHMMLFPILMGYLVLDTVFLAAAFLLVGLFMVSTISPLFTALCFHTRIVVAVAVMVCASFNCNAGAVAGAVMAAAMPMSHHRHNRRTAQQRNS